MRSDGICQVFDVDGVQVLVVAPFFHKDLKFKINEMKQIEPINFVMANLVVEIVQIFAHKEVNVPHDFKYVESLFKYKLLFITT